jgi:hypothetical protein
MNSNLSAPPSLLRIRLPRSVHLARPRDLIRGILAPPLPLQPPHQRQHLRAEGLKVLVVVQERQQHDIDAQALQQQDAVGHLLARANQLGLEAVIELHQVLELGVRPHALVVAGGGAGLLDRVPERLHRVPVRLALDLLQQPHGVGLGVAHDREAVDGEAHLALAAGLAGALAHVRDLLLEALERVAVHEVVVRGVRGVFARVGRVAALENQRVRPAREAQRPRRKGVVVELVEVTAVGELLTCPDAPEALDEFPAASAVR